MTTPQQYRPAHRAPSPNPAPVVEKHTTLLTPYEGPAMKALRAVTYVLCSLAAITFLLVVLYVNNKITEFQNTMDSIFGGGTSTSSSWPGPTDYPFGN